VLADLTSHYPFPVSLSPDGKWILLRTVTAAGNPFGLAVVDRASGRTAYTLSWQEPILRLAWRPDSSEISFFAMRGFEAGRDLYVWNLRQDQVRHLGTPLTTAEPQVRWAPSGRLLAFSDARQGLVVVDTSGASPPLVLAQDVSEFDWLADSSTIAVVENNELDRLDLIEVSTGTVRSHVFPGEIQIRNIAASPVRSSLLLAESSSSKLWRLEEFDTGTLKATTLVRSRSRIGSPLWLPNGRKFCFQRFEKTSVKVIVSDRLSGRSLRLKDWEGVNDIRGVLPDGNTIVVAHRGNSPVGLFALSMAGERARPIYTSHSESLPSIKAVTAFAVAADGAKVPLLVWRGQEEQGAPAAVIRVRGGEGTVQLPVWEEHIQLFLKRGIHFVGINYRGEGATGREYRADVLAAIQYAHGTLGVPYDRIVLLGHSTGAGLAAATCMVRPQWCGTLALVSFGRVEDDLLTPRQGQDHLRLMLFHPAYDSTTGFAVLENLKAAFGQEVLRDPLTSLYQFQDDHNLMHPRSWAAVYSEILAEFHKSTCAVDADEGKQDPSAH
jgi:dipeptidyl aminopeptidase/acylaminoacyl peptidase